MKNKKLNILVIDGSPRVNSNTRKLANLFIRLAEKDANLEIFDQIKEKLPLFDDNKRTAKHKSVRKLFSAVSNADCIIISSPEYHGSMSGAIKNTLDWLSLLPKYNPDKIKICGLIGGGGTFGNSGAMLQLMMAARSFHWWLMPDVLLNIPLIWDAFAGLKLKDKGHKKRLGDFTQNILTYGSFFKQFNKIDGCRST